MPWVQEVRVLDETRSRWAIRQEFMGQELEYSWVSTNLSPVPLRKIHWVAEEGEVKNRGQVRFSAENGSTTDCVVAMAIQYECPAPLVPVANSLGPFVNDIIAADLDRFADYAAQQLERSRAAKQEQES